MSLSSGFFNSVNHDRLYNAEDMSRLFDGLIRDGVFASIGTCMVVKANTKMTVNVGIGRAWFNHTWTLNDSILPVTLEPSHVLWPRIDAVVLEVNSEESVRLNSIKVVQGEPSTNPTKPTLTKSTLVNQYPLAYITVPAAATEIRQADIENTVGTTECPFVSGILEVISIDQLIPQWKDILNRFVEENTANFNTWMNNEKEAYAQWLQSNKDDYNKLVKDQTTSYQTWFDGIKNSYTNWFATIKEAYDANWAAFQKWESDSKSDYTSWFDGVKSTYDANWKEFQAWEKKTKDNFDAWYETIKNQLSGDVVAKINDRIDQLNAKMLSLIDASEGIVEDTVEAPIVLASADVLENGYDIVSAGPKLLPGTISKYPGLTHNDGAYDATTQTVTFGSEDNSGAYLSLDKYIYLKTEEEYTLSVDVEASAAISGATIGVERTGSSENVNTLPAGKSTQTFDFTYSGTGLAFVCYATGMSGKTVKLSNMKILRNGVTEANYGLYQDTNSVHIGPDTKFPLYGLHSYDGNTTIISPTNFEAYTVDQYNGKALLESAKLGVEAKREKVGLIKSDDKHLPDTIKAPLMVAGATRNLLKPTLATTTQNGITCTNNGDGTFTVNGTNSTNAVADFILDANAILENGLKVVGCPKGGSNDTFCLLPIIQFKSYASDSGISSENGRRNDIIIIRVASDYGDGDIISGISSENGRKNGSIIIRVAPGATVSNFIFKPMLTTDLDATYDDFVPYSGYDIKTCGKNLLNSPIEQGTLSGAYGSEIPSNTRVRTAEFIPVDSDKRYVITFKGVTRVGVHTYDFNKAQISDSGWKTSNNYIFSVEDNCKYVKFVFSNASGEITPSNVSNIMLTTDLNATYDDFEPYTEGPTIHIDSSTQFPLMGLETMEGETNIISPANIETYHTDDENGKVLLEMIYKAAESGGIYYSASTPTGAKTGDFWIKPSSGELMYYDGTNWALPKAGDVIGSDVVKSSTKPMHGRDVLWIDSANNNVMKHVDAAGNVTELAAGGVSVGATAPSNTKLLWIDTSSGGVAKYYNGSAWVATASVWG